MAYYPTTYTSASSEPVGSAGDWDEAAIRLARKRQLANLLQNESINKGLQLANPKAPGSWVNALAPMFQAYAAKSMGEEADTQALADQATRQQKVKDWIGQAPEGTPALPARPDMDQMVLDRAAAMKADQAQAPPQAPGITSTPRLDELAQPAPPTPTVAQIGADAIQNAPQFLPKQPDMAAPAGGPTPAAVPALLPQPTQPDQVGPPDPEALAEQKYGLPPGRLAAHRALERSAVGSVSPRGAMGPYQIMPDNVAKYSKAAGRQLDPNNPMDGAEMAAQVVKDGMNRYPDNDKAQVAYYNGGWKAADQIAAGNPSNSQTDDYVKRYQDMVQAQSAPGGPPIASTGAPPPGSAPPPLDQAPPPAATQQPPMTNAILPPQAAVAPTYKDIANWAANAPPGQMGSAFMSKVLDNIASMPEKQAAQAAALEDRKALRENTAAIWNLRLGQSGANAQTAAAARVAAAQAAHPAAAGMPGDLTLKNDPVAYHDSLDPRSQVIVDGFKSGDMNPKMSQLSKGERENLIAATKIVDPTYKDTRYPTVVDFASGKPAIEAKSLNQVAMHAGTLYDLYEKMDNGDWPAANAIANGWNRFWGRSEVPNTKEATQAVASEMMKVMRGAGAGSEKEIGAWIDNFPVNASLDTQKSQLQIGGKLMAGRYAALNNQWKTGTGFTTNHPTLIMPEARESLSKIGVDLGGDATPTSGMSGGGPVRVNTLEERDKLDKGTVYIGPDGVPRTKS